MTVYITRDVYTTPPECTTRVIKHIQSQNKHPIHHPGTSYTAPLAVSCLIISMGWYLDISKQVVSTDARAYHSIWRTATWRSGRCKGLAKAWPIAVGVVYTVIYGNYYHTPTCLECGSQTPLKTTVITPILSHPL